MSNNPAPSFTPDRSIPFAHHGDQPLLLDIFNPASPKPGQSESSSAAPGSALPPCASSPLSPAVLFIHGGGWSGGHRSQFHPHARHLASRGYFACSMQYRLSTLAPWPAQLHDCHDAFRYLLVHHADLRIDPHRIAVVGSSAGGHLAACLAVRDLPTLESNAVQMPEVNRPSCVVDIHGIHQFPHRMYCLTDAMHKLFRNSPNQAPDLYHDASPIHFIDDRTPPMLLTHDPADPLVPCEQSALFASALVIAGRSFDFIATPDSGHGFIYNLQNPASQKLWPQIVHWLDRHLLP